MSAELEGAFPNLADGYTVASPKTQAYYPGNQDPHKSLQRIRSSNSQLRLPRDQRSTTESTEIHGKENPNQLPVSVSFPGATPARRVGSFRGYPFVMIFLAGVIQLRCLGRRRREPVVGTRDLLAWYNRRRPRRADGPLHGPRLRTLRR